MTGQLKTGTKQIELNSGFAKAYYNRGNAYLVKSEIGEAIKDYDRVIGLDPDDFDAYITRGDAHLEEDDFDRAMESYEKAIELRPNDADAYIIRAEVYHKNGRFRSCHGRL